MELTMTIPAGGKGHPNYIGGGNSAGVGTAGAGAFGVLPPLMANMGLLRRPVETPG